VNDDETKFKALMWNAFKSSEMEMSAKRMARDYFKKLYTPLVKKAEEKKEKEKEEVKELVNIVVNMTQKPHSVSNIIFSGLLESARKTLSEFKGISEVAEVSLDIVGVEFEKEKGLDAEPMSMEQIKRFLRAA